MTILHVIGARPNFPKAAPVLAALTARGLAQRLVHTGQHYDDALSDVFFRQLGLPKPDVNLGVGSGGHAGQTGAIMLGLEELWLADRPSVVVVYGDVNSALAAALVAAKLTIPMAHVEAGLRSFDPSMPEEINRVVVDRLACLLFATSADAVAHLAREGTPPDRIHLVGNPMIDTLLAHRPDVERVRSELRLPDRYAVATLHRPANVDDDTDAAALVRSIHAVADLVPLVLPLHPRGRPALAAAGLLAHPRLRVLDPMGYLEFVALMHGAQLVVTDSGGVQEETTVLGVPCLTLRSTTERPVTISHGTNRLVTREALPDAVRAVLVAGRPARWPVPPLWDGHAGERIAAILQNFVGTDRAEAVSAPARP
jgi:UDP-N-acetylglucosamine 2-epimerase (non-hydrolysing)